jgi:hypothetical protein
MKGRAYRRKSIAIAGEFETIAAMEDDFHHFIVRLRHDGKRVTHIEGETIRFPWSVCPGAAVKLDEFIGVPINPTPDDPGPRLHITQHCTHLFDVAKFALAQTIRGGRRQYDMLIPDPVDGGSTTGDLWRDGAHLFHWVVEKRTVVSPESVAGHSLHGRAAWKPEAIPDADALEAALMLRRALVIFRGRVTEYPEVTKADQVPNGFGTCFTYQPENASDGRWVMEEMNYTESAEPLLAGFAR